jgi:hypothetical protein
MTDAGLWRTGAHRAEHVYEGQGTANPEDDPPIASFLGDAWAAAAHAAEACLAVNTVRALGTTSFTAEFRVEYLNAAGDWVVTSGGRWATDRREAERGWEHLLNHGYSAREVRMRQRWVSQPVDVNPAE